MRSYPKRRAPILSARRVNTGNGDQVNARRVLTSPESVKVPAVNQVVAERLGRATGSITLDTYLHAIPAPQQEEERIAGLVLAEGKEKSSA